jgi:hypothetical protein
MNCNQNDSPVLVNALRFSGAFVEIAGAALIGLAPWPDTTVCPRTSDCWIAVSRCSSDILSKVNRDSIRAIADSIGAFASSSVDMDLAPSVLL